MSRLTRGLRAAATRVAVDIPAILAVGGVGAMSAAAGAFHWALGLGAFGFFCLAGAWLIAQPEETTGE